MLGIKMDTLPFPKKCSRNFLETYEQPPRISANIYPELYFLNFNFLLIRLEFGLLIQAKGRNVDCMLNKNYVILKNPFKTSLTHEAARNN